MSFDLGVGDIFSVRLAGNMTSRKALGSIEYGCAVAGAKLVVMGQTRCEAVTAAVDLACSGRSAAEATGCQHLDHIVADVQKLLDVPECRAVSHLQPDGKRAFVDDVARRNVRQAVENMLRESRRLADLARDGPILIVGAMYDVATGGIEFLPDSRR